MFLMSYSSDRNSGLTRHHVFFVFVGVLALRSSRRTLPDFSPFHTFLPTFNCR